jgi:hypothetical protein
MTKTQERPTNLDDVEAYQSALAVLQRVQAEHAATQEAINAIDRQTISGDLQAEADAILDGSFNPELNGALRLKRADLVRVKTAQETAIAKQVVVVDRAKGSASMAICDGHADQYRELLERTRAAADELAELTKDRLDLREDLKERGVSWSLPSVRLFELDRRLPGLIGDIDEALAELDKEQK